MLNASGGAQLGVAWVVVLSIVYVVFAELNVVANQGIKSCLRALPSVCGSILARADTNRKTRRENNYSTHVSFSLMLRGIGDFTTELNNTDIGFLASTVLYQASYLILILLLRSESKHVKTVSQSQFIVGSTSALLCFVVTYSICGTFNVPDYQFIVNVQSFLMGMTLWRLTTRNQGLGMLSYRLSMCGGLLLYMSDIVIGSRRYNGVQLSAFDEIACHALYYTSHILMLLSTMCLKEQPVEPDAPSPEDKEEPKSTPKQLRKEKRRRKKARRN